MTDPGALARAVREALASLPGEPLRARFSAPLVTALVADAADVPWLGPALREVVEALERVGVPRGRQFALLGSATPDCSPGTRARALELKAELSLAVFAHDPHGTTYTAGRTADAVAIELDDELREAEAVVCIGRGEARAGRVQGGPYLLAPGVASLGLRSAIERAGERGRIALALAAEAAVTVDLAVCWDERGHVLAGRGREQFAALAREAGFE
jgi:hypothetical protein